MDMMTELKKKVPPSSLLRMIRISLNTRGGLYVLLTEES